MTTIPESFGTTPINYKWTVVRGDSASLKIYFLENDEKTIFDTSSWSFSSTVYDAIGDVADELEVIVNEGYIEIIAASDITANWGIGYRGTINELVFDLQVEFDDTVWTPIIGTIELRADITGSGL